MNTNFSKIVSDLPIFHGSFVNKFNRLLATGYTIDLLEIYSLSFQLNNIFKLNFCVVSNDFVELNLDVSTIKRIRTSKILGVVKILYLIIVFPSRLTYFVTVNRT